MLAAAFDGCQPFVQALSLGVRYVAREQTP